ncbi:beta-aspartyl-dipeptidase (metallo-type) [Evansella caseinilytica]|uniref:Isoaspartyl dipeptidase n=1 Tax=Evansella caseinilytica TaxID=1503961 RepID=A0A1H3PPS1_9BACI|nr:beta-aspartyl-peptidase [Evansella caseinilytica]SDZ03018.1 beta-aspartyl-dipeptidase (metallo-type) [Evansella caseinilytica]
MIKLIINGELFRPQFSGKQQILIADGRIAALEKEIDITSLQKHVDVYDAKGKIIIPGLIDGHVHITGGGGEGSFKTRTPELSLSDCIKGGITTVVGVLGTDGTGRTMTNLVAKAKGLTEEGITCYCKSGNYHLPVKTLTGSVETDIMYIQEIIGAGEVAISDHRSSQPTKEELARLASEARIGGILSGKGGVVVVHVGSGEGKLNILEEIVSTTDIPLSQFLPTHINRTEELLAAGIEYAKSGGYVDFTTSSVQENDNELSSSKCLKRLLDKGIAVEQITFTSDGQGSLPRFDENGQFLGLGVGRVTSLFDEVRQAVIEENIQLETALQVATANPADILKLHHKGRIEQGKDADIVILDRSTLRIDGVIAKGQWLMQDQKLLVKGTFE